MKHIFEYWRQLNGAKRKGYTVADITFTADGSDCNDTQWYGRDRKTLQAAINDAKRQQQKNRHLTYDVYARAVLTEYYDNGEQRRKTNEEAVLLGGLDERGNYYSMYQDPDWLTKA